MQEPPLLKVEPERTEIELFRVLHAHWRLMSAMIHRLSKEQEREIVFRKCAKLL